MSSAKISHQSILFRMEYLTDLKAELLVVSSYPINNVAGDDTSEALLLFVLHWYQHDLLIWKYEANELKTKKFFIDDIRHLPITLWQVS